MWLLLALLLIPNSNATPTQISTFSVTGEHAGLVSNGLTTQNISNFDKGITICTRFNYKQLSTQSWIFTQGALSWIFAGYQESFLMFGNINWILKDPKTQSFRMWITNRWHHICLSYDRNTSHISLMKVM